MPTQSSSSNEKTYICSTNALNNGVFVLTSLELKEGDTLVLGQLGDPCLPKGALARLPEGIEVINLDFSEFENESYSFEAKDEYGWESYPEWPCEYLGADNAVPFRKYSKELLGLAKSKPAGTVKCLFDLSNYPIGTLDPISPNLGFSKFDNYRRRKSTSLEQPSTKWNWDALDEFIAGLVKKTDPMQWNRATEWGPFLYSAFANLVCENGLSATILPEAYLRDANYLQARNSFLGDRTIRSVIYLGHTNIKRDYPAIFLTSKRQNEGQVLFVYAALGTNIRAMIAGKLNLNSDDEVFTAAANSMLHSEWKEEDRKRIGLGRRWRFEVSEQLLSRNEVRLDSTISDFYYSYRGYEARLCDEVSKVQSYSSTAIKRRRSKNALVSSADKASQNINGSDETAAYPYYMFPLSAANRAELVHLDKQLPKEHCLRAGDILITRVVRPSSERVSNATGLTVLLIKEDDILMSRFDDDSPVEGKWLCPTSCICIRPKTNDLVYSFALYEYLSAGHGKESLSAIAKISGSFTWDRLSAIELPPPLVSESDEWQTFKLEVEKVALPYFDAYKDRCKATRHANTKLKEAYEALSTKLR